ncbi:MAG: LysR family transcriptional regulator [Dehalococcoidia bacterium]
MNLQQLKSFRVAAERGSFSKAAEELYLSQPTISLHVRNLEQELGVELFERGGRHTRLSDAGEVVLKYANQFEGLLASMQQQLSSVSTAVQSVAIGTSPSGANRWLPKILRDFRQIAPDVSVRVAVMPPHAVAEQLIRGTLDFGLLSRALITEGIAAVPLKRVPLLLVCAPHHPLAHETFATPLEIARHAFVVLAPPSEAYNLVHVWASTQGIRLNVAVEIESHDGVKEAVLNGVGLAFLPQDLVQRYIDAGQLTTIDTDGLPLMHVMCIAYRAFDALSEPAVRFLETMRARQAPDLAQLLWRPGASPATDQNGSDTKVNGHAAGISSPAT